MEIQEKVSLKNYSTYKIGGQTEYFCALKKQRDVVDAVDFAKRNEMKIFFLGGGSNILFSDSGFGGIIARIENDNIEVISENDEVVKVKCGAGVPLSKLANFCLEKGLTGLEWSAGIPGTVGGAVRGNAGAYGGEIKDNTAKVWAIDTGDEDLGIQEVEAGNCDFDYRNSLFKENEDLLIWEIEFDFKRGEEGQIKKTMSDIITKRNENQPSVGEFPSAGCIFKNPIVDGEVVKLFEADQETESRDGKVPAGWLIDRCDLKGETIGGAMVSRKQANFIVNTGEATSEDVIILMSMIKMKVRNQFGVQLEEEVKVLL